MRRGVIARARGGFVCWCGGSEEGVRCWVAWFFFLDGKGEEDRGLSWEWGSEFVKAGGSAARVSLRERG